MTIISGDLFKTIKLQRSILYLQILTPFVCYGLVIYNLVKNPDNYQNFDLFEAALIVYLMCFTAACISVYHQFKYYEDVLFIGYKLKEINKQQTFHNMAQLELHYKYHEIGFIQSIYVQMKLLFEVYCCNSCAGLHIVLFCPIFYWFKLQLDDNKSFDAEILYAVVFVSIVNVREVVLLTCGIIIEFPRRVHQYCKVRQRMKKQESLLSQYECSICLSPFEQGIEVTLQCHPNHVFHQECIDLWRRTKDLCPLCRRPIVIVPKIVTNA